MKSVDLTLFRDAIKILVVQTVKALKLNRVVYAELVSVSPLTFKRSTDIVIKADVITLPYQKEFSTKEIGSTHAFIQEDGWQKYVYLHRIG